MNRSLILAPLFALAVSLPAPAATPVGFDAVATTTPRPVGIENAGDGGGRLFIVLQPGIILIFDGEQLLPQPFLDITDRVGAGGSEQGLLGLAFHDTRPFCDLALDAVAYGAGDALTLETLRLVNRGETATAVRAQLGVVPPGGGFRALLDRQLTLAADTDRDLGPRELFEVTAGTPKGSYELICRLLDDAGEEIARDAQRFEVL